MVKEADRYVVLVVEDEPFVRMLAVDALTDHGMIVLEADCVDDALEVMNEAGHIDLLFTDINMPGDLDGVDLAQIAHDRHPDMKIIITSGGQMLKTADIPDHGIFIAKPYGAHALTNLVDNKRAALQ